MYNYELISKDLLTYLVMEICDDSQDSRLKPLRHYKPRNFSLIHKRVARVPKKLREEMNREKIEIIQHSCRKVSQVGP